MNVVTGAFGYIGKYIARQLLDQGQGVKTITTHPNKPSPFGSNVEAYPYNFDRPDLLVQSLRGASTLYNTYLIRFEYGSVSFGRAVQNTTTLFRCAREAGISKIVHISVTHASVGSQLPYYRGKGLQERALLESGAAYSIVRPTLVFGREDILINNIAWLIRKFPVFPIFGSGDYFVQPVFVGDLATIAIESSRDSRSTVLDSIGPETYSFAGLVRLIGSKIRPGVKLIHVPPVLGIALGRMIGVAVDDILLTRDELRGLMANLLTSDQAPNGSTRFSDWLEAEKEAIGSNYSSELNRHYHWTAAVGRGL